MSLDQDLIAAVRDMEREDQLAIERERARRRASAKKALKELEGALPHMRNMIEAFGRVVLR